MTKRQFLDELKNRLATLPARERENALRYYSDFFEDADGENEESIAKDLGSPLEVADIILRDYYTTIQQQSDYSSKNARQGAGAGANNATYRSPAFTPWYEQDAKKEGNFFRRFFSDLGDFISDLFKGSNRWLFWLLVLLCSPVWFPLFLAVAGAVFGVFATMLGLAFGGVVLLIALYFTSCVILFAGFSLLFATPFGGAVTIAAGVALLGVTMLITIPIFMLIGLVPKICKAFFGAFKTPQPMNVPPPSYAQYAGNPTENPAPTPPQEPATAPVEEKVHSGEVVNTTETAEDKKNA